MAPGRETDMLEPIAHIHTDLPSKFGIPRQSNLAQGLEGRIVFTSRYRTADAVRGIEGFDYLWLIWDFSQTHREGEGWSATVKPPRLGGNERVGVFASRSPFRPNSLGLSSVRLEGVEYTEDLGPVLRVSGMDLMDGTPIYDIKPYLPFTDSHPDARGGYTDQVPLRKLEVVFPEELEALVPEEKREALRQILACDPRPAYHDDPQRRYGFPFGDKDVKDVRFKVEDGVLTVVEIADPGDGVEPSA